MAVMVLVLGTNFIVDEIFLFSWHAIISPNILICKQTKIDLNFAWNYASVIFELEKFNNDMRFCSFNSLPYYFSIINIFSIADWCVATTTTTP